MYCLYTSESDIESLPPHCKGLGNVVADIQWDILTSARLVAYTTSHRYTSWFHPNWHHRLSWIYFNVLYIHLKFKLLMGLFRADRLKMSVEQYRTNLTLWSSLCIIWCSQLQHELLRLCWFNVEPASQAVIKGMLNVSWMPRADIYAIAKLEYQHKVAGICYRRKRELRGMSIWIYKNETSCLCRPPCFDGSTSYFAQRIGLGLEGGQWAFKFYLNWLSFIINPYSAGINFSRQNLTSVDVRSIPAL